MTVEERRQALLEWFYADEERNGWGTTKVAKQATSLPMCGRKFGYNVWLYPAERRGRDQAFRDLRAHVRSGNLTRGQSNGRATWWYA